MKTFFNAAERPPIGGWHYYTDPKTQTGRIKKASPREVFEQIKRYRVNNSTFTSDEKLWEELWNYWCGREPERCGLNTPPVPDFEPHQITWQDVALFAGMAALAISSGQPLVDQAEAERRAAICAGCPMNQPLNDCPHCREAINALAQKMGGLSTSRDGELKACSVCGCELKASVHVNLEAQQRVLKPEMSARLPEWCWKRKLP